MGANGADRVRAVRLRAQIRAGKPVPKEEADWLNNYDEERIREKQARGASASRKVSFTEEETAAVGIGEGAAEAAAGAAMVREEGRRLDSLVTISINAMARACELHEKMAAQMLAERMADGKVQRALLEAVRGHYLARVEAEADAIEAQRQAEGESDPINKAIADMMPQLAAMVASAVQSSGK